MKKIILSVIICICTVSVNAVNIGDKVVLSKDASKYATGQQIPSKFLGKSYTVQQVGCKQFPDGVLLKEIFSWVKGVDAGMATKEQENNTLNVAKLATDQLGRQYVILYDTIVKVKTDTVVIRDTVYADRRVEIAIDTVLKVNRKVIINYDTLFVDGSKQWQPKDTIYLTQHDTLVTIKQDTTVNLPFNRFSIGVRGGLSSYLMDAKQLRSDIGYAAFLDLQYAYYFKRSADNKPFCGILFGLSAGYNSAAVEGAVNDQYTTTDAAGDKLDYTITASNVKQTLNEFQVQVPLMFSLLYHGLFFNIGPRFVVPVYASYNQQLENPHIKAYYEPYGVTITDDMYIGKVSEDQLQTTGKWSNAQFKLYLSLEMGYEFELKNKNSFGIGLYADYCAFSTYKDAVNGKGLISISQIGEDPLNPVPNVTVQSALNSYSTKLNGFDAGIKLVYNINIKRK